MKSSENFWIAFNAVLTALCLYLIFVIVYQRHGNSKSLDSDVSKDGRTYYKSYKCEGGHEISIRE